MRVLIYLIFILNTYYSQTIDQVKEAKKVVKKMGLSEREARKLAKDRGYSDEQIASIISSTWNARDDRYSEMRSELTSELQKVEMSYIGG